MTACSTCSAPAVQDEALCEDCLVRDLVEYCVRYDRDADPAPVDLVLWPLRERLPDDDR